MGLGAEPRALICRCPPHSLAKLAAWRPTAPRESASTLCWAEGSAGIWGSLELGLISTPV